MARVYCTLAYAARWLVIPPALIMCPLAVPGLGVKVRADEENSDSPTRSPEPVCPYAKQHPLKPFMMFSTWGFATACLGRADEPTDEPTDVCKQSRDAKTARKSGACLFNIRGVACAARQRCPRYDTTGVVLEGSFF